MVYFVIVGGNIHVFTQHYESRDDAMEATCGLVVSQQRVGMVVDRSCPVFLFARNLISDDELDWECDAFALS